jgi:diguanylate cyclase (GGDEF)-like protein/PAS domain S-box-containing protein
VGAAPIPPDESARLAALARYEILDTPTEPAFDRLTRLAARLLDVPIALVSLVDEERQWWKARLGLPGVETPRDDAFCAHAILGREPLVVADAARDERFARNPLVTGAPHIRAYAGAPLVTPDGHRIGTLCVIDRRPRDFSPEQVAVLADLSSLVMDELELRLQRRLAVEGAQQARQSVEEMRILFEHAPLALWTLDPEGIVLSWNRAAEQAFGWTAAEAVGHFLPTVGPAERASYDELARELARERSARVVERKRLRKDGSPIDVRLAVSPLFDDQDRLRGFLSIAQDVTEELRLREELRRAALIDPMTGLLNRRGFVEMAAREVARARRDRANLAVIMFDLDHFKRINDTRGHAVGDRVLATVARIVRQNLRGMDVGTRWGGEEMLVLLPGTDAAGARVVAERTRSTVAALLEPGLPSVTISGGIATWEPGEGIDATVARADRALYEAKAAGRNRVC